MSLNRPAISAVRWTTISALVRALLAIAQLMLLARLLVPADFGLMAVTAAIIAVVTLFSDLGVNRLIMHRRDLSQETLRSLYWINLLAATLLALLLVVISRWVAVIYREPELADVLAWSALVFPLSAIGSQFRTLAACEMRFDVLARSEIIAALLGFLAAAWSAFAGLGVYALVVAALATTATGSLLAWVWLSAGYRPGWRITLHGLRGHYGFGGFVVGESLVAALNRELDVFLGGALVGPAAMGVYSLPRDLCLRIANTVVNPAVNRVSIPVMAKVQDNTVQLRRVYLESLRMTSSVNFPVYVLIGLFAEDVVATLYGARWHEAVFYLQVLAAWGLLRSMGNPVGSLVIAAGVARRAFAWNLAMLLVTPCALWLGVSIGGVPGLALAMLAMQVVMMMPMWRFLVTPYCGAGWFDCLGLLLPVLSMAVLSGLLAVGTVHAIDGSWVRLALGGVVMAAIYLALSSRYNREWFDAMARLLGMTKYPDRGN
ncbi:MAG: MOP flippase family protein [Pseudomonadota bacterium]